MDNKDLMTKVKFLGKIKVGDKINTRQNLHLQPDSYYTKFSRTLVLQDSRTNALIFVYDTIKQSLDYLDLLIKNVSSVNKIHINVLLKDLKNAKSGIKNLSETYISDHYIISELETIMQSIQFKLDEVKLMGFEGTDILPSTSPLKITSSAPISIKTVNSINNSGTPYENNLMDELSDNEHFLKSKSYDC